MTSDKVLRSLLWFSIVLRCILHIDQSEWNSEAYPSVMKLASLYRTKSQQRLEILTLDVGRICCRVLSLIKSSFNQRRATRDFSKIVGLGISSTLFSPRLLAEPKRASLAAEPRRLVVGKLYGIECWTQFSFSKWFEYSGWGNNQLLWQISYRFFLWDAMLCGRAINVALNFQAILCFVTCRSRSSPNQVKNSF
jgi:hypothetical protein